MSKTLPYFKFIVSEWMNGTITLEDYDTQGVFINLCAYYWHKSGILTLTEIKRRLKDAKPNAFQSLIDNDLIQVKDDKISVQFLDEQLNERGYISKINSENGKLGGRPKGAETGELKPNAFQSESESLTKKSNIEEEKKRKEIEKKKNLEDRKLKFALTLEPFKDIYSREMLKAFLRYWSEPNKSMTKFKQELQKTWDIEGRLETWASNDKNFTKDKPQKQTAVYGTKNIE